MEENRSQKFLVWTKLLFQSKNINSPVAVSPPERHWASYQLCDIRIACCLAYVVFNINLCIENTMSTEI